MTSDIASTLLVAALMQAQPSQPIRVLEVPRDYPTIQAAIDSARADDTVLVSPGRYVENLRIARRGVVLASHFARTGNPQDIERTIIDGSKPRHPDTASVIIVHAVERGTAVVQGFTITGGAGTVWLDAKDTELFREGGGILCELSAPVIRDNYIVGNKAVEVRKGVFSAGGGGIRCGYAEPTIVNNVIRDNEGRYGGGVVLFHSAATVRNNLVVGNRGGEDFGGAGLWVVGHLSRRLANVIEHNTIVRNTAVGADTGRFREIRGRGGAMWTMGTDVEFRYNIVWGNEQVAGGPIGYPPPTPPSMSHNIIQGGAPGEGNRDTDPRFADTVRYELTANSPARGKPELGAYGGEMGKRLLR
ncbi:MAG TPA: right-handed parallel beta-helix repeat-containing protein [Gemmatimonadaceae bacterium]|nr:right-handed parallel beta-helix repeat-containing protein [Gemmatimonadaceae bacterium]